MKLALLADIHGNADALSVVLRAVRQSGAERILVAGDLVNYYADAKRVFDMLDEWDWLSVRGNHDAIMETYHRGEDVNAIHAKYGTALAVAVKELDGLRIEKLAGLPTVLDLEINRRRVLLCHGTPWNRDEYVYPDAPQDVKTRFAEDGLDLVVYGHTHYPIVWRSGETLVVNPGSVGQPRDRKPGACWAMWDANSNTVELHRESYDVEPLIARCKARDPDVPFLWQALIRTADTQ